AAADRAPTEPGQAAAGHAGEYAELAGRLALRLTAFLAIRSYDAERDQVLQSATRCVRRHGTDALLARLLSAQFEAAGQRDRRAVLPDLARETLEAARRSGERELELHALSQAARAARMRGDVGTAIQLLEEAVAAAREPGRHRMLLARAVADLANTYLEAGRAGEAVPLYREALPVFRAERRHRRVAQTLTTYAGALVERGELDAAEAAVGEALRITGEIGDEVGSAYVLLTGAQVLRARGELAAAAERIARATGELERLGNRSGIASALRDGADIAVLDGRPGDALAALRRGLALVREIDLPLEEARILVRLRHAYRLTGDPEPADRYAAQLAERVDELGLALASVRLPDYVAHAEASSLPEALDTCLQTRPPDS
ncbi:MAG: tetratricopeptide repeat protein, partial [Micromonosporaceae bacterium]